MNKNAFPSTRAGKVVLNMQGHPAFLPASLPPQLSWTPALLAAHSAADRAIGRLCGLAERVSIPQPLVRFFLRREAELSSRIEGTHASAQQTALYERDESIEREAGDVREVWNNFKALEFGTQSLPSRSLSLGLIEALHQTLLTDVRGHDQTPGAFRKIQAHIGRSNRIEEARFVPAPPTAIDDCMRDFERYVNSDDPMPALARAAIIHYQFEAIHPFADGNGRIGRLIIILFLIQQKVIPLPLLNPSAYLERNRRDYYDHLLSVSQRGEWEAWIEFFLNGITNEALDAMSRVEQLEALRARYQAQVRTRRASALLPKLIDQLFAEPAITVNSAAEFLGIGYTSAKKLLDRLLDVGIIRKAAGRRKTHIFVAQGVVDLFESRS